MSRLVLTGTEGKLYRLTEKDLPDDHDLRGSCLKYCDLSGLDLSAYNCELMDIHDSDCRGVVLPDSVDFTVSLRGDWTGATIPKSLPLCAWSLVGEVLKRHTAPAGSREAEMIEWVIPLIANAHDDPRNPWYAANHHFQVNLGAPTSEYIPVFERYAFAGYPNLLRMLRSLRDVPPERVGERPEPFMRVIEPNSLKDDLWVPHAQIRPFGTEDRWAAARMTEQYLNQHFQTDGWQVMVFFLVPHVWAVALHRDQMTEPFEWWRLMWPS